MNEEGFKCCVGSRQGLVGLGMIFLVAPGAWLTLVNDG